VVPEPNFPAQPDEFIGRNNQIEAFREVLAQGLLTGRTPSFAVLGDWGVGKSSLLLKYSAICSGQDYAMLPVFFSVSTELADYKRFAEGLLDTFARALETSDSLATRLRGELQKWKLSKLSIGGVSLNRQGPEFFLSSGTAILKHALHDAWRHFIRPAQLKGAIFFLDDLHNFFYPGAQGIALALRDQFQEFAIHGVNYSLCFSARSDYFSDIRSFAEPAVRFYDKVYLSSFTPQETDEYTAAVFGDSVQIRHLSSWLYEKTFGHPYFLAFVSRQLLSLAQGHVSEPERFWPAIFKRLEQEKFRSDLAHVTEREVQLLRDVANAPIEEIGPRELSNQYERKYFSRLTEKSLLVRVGRGRYKLYHPLFRLFLKEG
jgi:AAA ATPase domain